MDIIYPYILPEPNDGGEELKYSLRSLEKYFDNFRVIIIGQRPAWLRNVGFVEFRRRPPSWRDVNSKIYELMTSNVVGDEFILMNDDFYLVNDLDLLDFTELRAIRELDENNLWDNPRRRGPESLRALNNAYLRIRERFNDVDGLKVWDYESHLPRLFNKEQLLALYDEFDLCNRQISISTLYFNYYFQEETPKIIKDYSVSNNTVLRIMTNTDYEWRVFKLLISNKQFVTNNQLSFFRVSAHLANLFPNRSSFEIVAR